MALASGIMQQREQSLGLWRVWAPGFGLVLCLCAYLVVMPSVNVLPGVLPYDTKRIGEVLLLLGTGGWLLLRPQAATRWLDVFSQIPRLGRWALGVVIGLGVCSALLAPLPSWALLEVGHLVLLGGLAISIAAFFRHNPAAMQRWLLGALLLSVFLYLINFVISYSLSLQIATTGLWPRGVNIGFAHPRFLNQFQTWTLPLIVLPALIWPMRRRITRWGLYGLAMCWWMILFGSGGRGTPLALIVAGIFVSLVYRKQAWPWLRAQGIGVVGGGILYGVLFKVLVASQASLLDRSLTSGSMREMLWEQAWVMMQHHPLLGVGPMHYAYYVEDSVAHPHNVVLQWAAEWGVPAALLMAGLFLWGLYALVQHFRNRDAVSSHQHVVHVALTASLVAAIGHALLSGVTIMPLSQLMMVLVIGWAWGLWMPPEKQPVGAPPRSSMWMLRLVLIASLFATAWGAGRYVFDLKHQQAVYQEAKPNIIFRPRFWQQGLLKFYE